MQTQPHNFIYLFIYLPWHEYPHMGIALSLSSFVMLSHIYRRESMYSLISAYDWNKKTNGHINCVRLLHNYDDL